MVQNLYKFWAQNVSIPQELKCFNTPTLYIIDTLSYNSSINIGSISFFLSSDKHQSQHLLECHTTGTNSSSFFKFFTFFKFNMPI